MVAGGGGGFQRIFLQLLILFKIELATTVTQTITNATCLVKHEF